ncbi:MFS transporter [Chloroflexota bacterium]
MSELPADEPTRRRIWGLNPNIFFLGLVSLLTDVSSEMIFTLIPLFLCNVLGVGATIVGLVGGLTESTDAILRIFSGRISDRVGKRKFLAVISYSVSTIAKPFMYLASTWGMVLAVNSATESARALVHPLVTLWWLIRCQRARGAGALVFTGEWTPPGLSWGWP